MPQETLRTFIALELEESAKETIVRIQEQLRQANVIKGSWVKKENLHLTLKFLGDTPQKRIDDIREALQKDFTVFSAVPCNLQSVGAFPNERSARVLWVGIQQGKTQIAEIAGTVEGALVPLGFKKEKRDFKTHITICRIKNVLDHIKFSAMIGQINSSFQPLAFTACAITFLESKLTPQGSVYTPLFNYRLQKPTI